MSKKISIMLEKHYEEFINSKLKIGKYRNASEVITAALQLLEEEEGKQAMLKKAIQDGIDSGVATNFGPTIHLRELKKLKSLNE